jgi:hypothetical protein
MRVVRSALSKAKTVRVCVQLLVATLGACRPGPVLDNVNELPFGVIDSPKSGEKVGRVVEVIGWALDDSRVSLIRVFVDDRHRVTTALTIPRPDVSKSFLKFLERTAHHDDLHGWKASVDLGANPGEHRILAKAVDDNGATRDIGSVTVILIGRQ